MITESQIREKVDALCSNSLDFESFEDWLASQSWNMHRDSDAVAQRLVGAIELRLSEFSSGHLSESKLRAEIKELVPPNSGMVFVIAKTNLVEPRVVSSGTSIWMESPLMPLRPLEHVGI